MKKISVMFLSVFLLLLSGYSYSFFSYQYESILNRNSITIGRGVSLDPPVNAYSLSVLFSWIPAYDFVLVSGGNGSYFAYIDKGIAVVIRDSSGYLYQDKIKEFLYLKYKTYPLNKMDLMDFVKDVSNFYIFPAFVIGSSKLCQDYSHSGVLSAWLGAKEKRKSVFESYCKDPTVALDKKSNKWNISYFVFDNTGAVLHFNVVGSIEPYGISKVTIQTVKESGTFRYPING